MKQFSFWEKDSFFAPQQVIIVGSGFVGLWSAFHLKLKNPTWKITILERGFIPTGASTRNAGFSCFGSPGELVADAVTMGEDKMWQLVEMRYKGLKQIRKNFTDEAIEYDPCGGYECFSSQSADWDDVADKLGWLNAGLKKITGEENLFKITDEKLNSFGFKGFTHLVENKLEAGIHSGKTVQALLQKIQGMGVQVLTNIEVLSYENHHHGVRINAINAGKAAQEICFTTNQLLLCTNAFTKQLEPSLDIVPNRGQVLITEPIEQLAFRGTFHFDQGYYYFRNVGKRLLLGGARNKDFVNENTLELGTTKVIQNALENFMRQHLLPQTAYTIADTWSGIMAMGKEKSPLIENIGNDVFCCVRMSGMGVALAPEAAEQITAIMSS